MAQGFDELDFRNYLENWCENCGEPGYYMLKPGHENDVHLVICMACQAESSFAWCENCGMGGDFIRNISERPSNWRCQECKTVYSIPSYVYDSPVYAYNEHSAPLEVAEKIHTLKKKYNQKGGIKKFSPFLVIILIYLLAHGFLP